LIKVNGLRVKSFPIEIEYEKDGIKKVYYVKENRQKDGCYMNTQCDMKDMIERLERERILK
jgi:hypothetical protein